MTDYSVTKTIAVHDAPSPRAAAAEFFKGYGIEVEEYGALVRVDWVDDCGSEHFELVVVKPEDLHTCGAFDLRGHCVECKEYPTTEPPPTGVIGVNQGRRDWDRRHGRG